MLIWEELRRGLRKFLGKKIKTRTCVQSRAWHGCRLP